MVEQLGAAGLLIGEPRPIQHPVKFYDRGERPLEIVTSRQWYIRNGGRDADLRAGARGSWQARSRGTPPTCSTATSNWVEGLNGDWLVSRQRFFGVPVPVWYPLDDHGEPGYDDPLLPAEAAPADRPVDRTSRGRRFTDRRDQPLHPHPRPDRHLGHLVAEAQSGRWGGGPDLFARVFRWTFDRRATRSSAPSPSSHDHSSHYELGWRPLAACGAVRVDPRHRPQDMLKSNGNVVTPLDCRAVRHRRRAPLVGFAPPWRRYRRQRGPDEVGLKLAPAAQRHEVRPAVRRSRPFTTVSMTGSMS